jgi:GNAT superfamily N-acetyltransferase
MSNPIIHFPISYLRIRESEFPKDMRNLPDYAFGILESGELLGVAGIFETDWYLEFGSLWVHEKIRRQGFARLLLEARIEYVKNKISFPELVFSRTGNKKVQNLLFEYGFNFAGFHDGTGDQVLMAYRSELAKTAI